MLNKGARVGYWREPVNKELNSRENIDPGNQLDHRGQFLLYKRTRAVNACSLVGLPAAAVGSAVTRIRGASCSAGWSCGTVEAAAVRNAVARIWGGSRACVDHD